MNISKIANGVKEIAQSAKATKAAKKAIKELSENFNESKIAKDLDAAAVLGKSMVKKTKLAPDTQEVVQKVFDKTGKLAKTVTITIDDKALDKMSFATQVATNVATENAGNVLDKTYTRVFSSEKGAQIGEIAKNIICDYKELSAHDAVKSATELVEAIGVQSGKSAKASAEVMGTAKNALEKQLDMAELKEQLQKKFDAKKAAELAQKAKDEFAYNNSYLGKMNAIDKIIDQKFN